MGKTFLATSELLGTIMGAGFLAIPFVVAQSGFAIGLLHLILIGSLITIVMLYLGEIVLRTKEYHQLPGYAEKYLGQQGKRWMSFAVLFGISTALLAYLIAEGESISVLLFGSPIQSLLSGIIFWALLSLLSLGGIRTLKKGESIGVILVFVMMISILVLFASKINLTNLTTIHAEHLFTPFGIILFAFLAFTALPEVKLILRNDKHLLKRSIIISHLLAFTLYVLFTLLVIGFKGTATPEIATFALGKPFILLGMITMFTSYLSLSMSMMDTLHFDFKKTRSYAWIITIAIPIILYVLLNIFNQATFTTVLSVGGIISGGITALLILAMVRRAKEHGNSSSPYSMPSNKIFLAILALIFIIGAITELISLLL
ncbi:MAG: aromatic amino acid transport family protein [Nanoarchaeota archaeon]